MQVFFQKIFLYTKVLVFSTGVWYSTYYLTLHIALIALRYFFPHENRAVLQRI